MHASREGLNMVDKELTEGQRRSRENLIPYKPGESGNPSGGRKGKSLTAVLRELLEQIPKGDTAKLKERIVKALLDKALRGDTRALDIIFDRSDGKVTLPIGGDKENPIYTITVSSEEGKKDVERLLNGERT